MRSRRPYKPCFALPVMAIAAALAISPLALAPCVAQPVAAPVVKTDAAPTRQYRLRFFWGEGPSAQWSGRLSVDRGTLSKLQLLAGKDSPEAHLEAGAVKIHQASPTQRGAFDITIDSPPEATLRLELKQANAPTPEVFEIPVADVAQRPMRRRLGQAGASVLVHRAEADRLRVDTERDQLLFSPGETFNFRLTAALPELQAGAPLDLAVDLLRGRGSKPIWSASPQRLAVPVESFATAEVSVPLPREEGVYTVRMLALRPPGSVKAWIPGQNGTVITERRFQVVVFDPSRTPTALPSWKLLREIDPTTKRWWDRLPKWVWLRRAPWLPEGPLGNSATRVVSLTSGRVIELPSTGKEPPPWQAYPLPVERAGRPYLVEVDYPADEAQELILTIMDQDDRGNAGPLGSSAKVTVSGWGGREGQRTARRIFWPKSQTPLLVLSNGDPERPARYGRIRVMEVDPSKATQPSTERPGSYANAPWALAHINTIDLPAAFGASMGGNPEHADWQTYHETTSRLADWIAATQQSGAVLVALSRDGSLFPWNSVNQDGTSPQQLASGVDDVPEVDALELLYREFDRRQLKLVAKLQADDPSKLLKAARVLANRYARHPSFAGAALDIDSLLPATPDAIPTQQWLHSISQAIDADGQRARLLVLANGLADSPRFAKNLRPQLVAELRVEQALSALQLATNHPGVVFVPPRFTTGSQALVDEAQALQLNTAARRLPSAAVGIYAEPSTQRLTDFEAASPFGAKQTSGRLKLASAGDLLLSAHAPLLAEPGKTVVLCGSPYPSLMLDDRLLSLRQTISLIPTNAAQNTQTKHQPIVVRAIESSPAQDGIQPGTLLQIANPSPWPAEANITIRTPDETSAFDLLRPADHLSYGPGEHVLRVRLPAQQAQLLQFDLPGVEPKGISGPVSDLAIQQLEAQLDELRNRNLNVRRQLESGPSPSFEGVGPDGRVADWGAIAQPSAGSVSIVKQQPADGQQAVRLTSTTGSVGVQSRAFTTPPTGQLAMVFSVRAGQLTNDAELRVVFEQVGGDYRSFTVMNAEQLKEAQENWRPFVLSVDDLPLGSESQMRIRFDLAGGGQVDIDDLKLFDLVFPLDFLGAEATKQRLALIKTIHAAESALKAGRLSDCRQQLESYWPRFIQAYTPLIERAPEQQPTPQVARVETVAPTSASDETSADKDNAEKREDSSPGFSDRLREYLPSFMRF